MIRSDANATKWVNAEAIGGHVRLTILWETSDRPGLARAIVLLSPDQIPELRGLLRRAQNNARTT